MHIYPLSCISCQENLLILGGCHMRAGVLTCESVTEYVQAAQRRLGTDYPVFVLHYRDTDDPERMKRQIVQAVEGLPGNIDTVLVAMGFCGGSWNQVKAARRLVIPRVDDCVSLLINGTVQHSANPKQMGHLYITERQPDSHGKRLCQQCPRWKADACYSRWFANHSQLDIVDTGVFDCHSEAYVGAAQECADALHCCLGYVSGSNSLLERLIGGQWENGFLVANPGQIIGHKDFFC